MLCRLFAVCGIKDEFTTRIRYSCFSLYVQHAFYSKEHFTYTVKPALNGPFIKRNLP